MLPEFDSKAVVVLGLSSIITAHYISTRYGMIWPRELSFTALSFFIFLMIFKERRWLSLKLLPIKAILTSDGSDQSNILPEFLQLRRSGVAVLKRGNKVNVISGIKVSGNPGLNLIGEQDLQRTRPFGYEYLPIFMRYRDLFVSLQRLAIPIRYIVLLSPVDIHSPDSKREIRVIENEIKKIEDSKLKGKPSSWNDENQLEKRYYIARKYGFIEVSQFLIVELSGSSSQLEKLEEQSISFAEKVLLAVSTAFTELKVEMATPTEMLKALYSLFWNGPHEGEMILPQEATPILNFSLPMVEKYQNIYSLFPMMPPNDLASHSLHLGWVEHMGRPIGCFTLDFNDLTKHLTIIGSTGSGKSTTAKRIVEECARVGIPVLIFDWHNEYREFVKRYGGEVYAPGLEDSGFTISPLDPLSTRDLAEHVALTTDIFAENYSLTHPQAFMLREAIRDVLSDHEGPHTLSEVVEAIESAPTRSYYDNETKMALLRRLKPLTEGQAGRALGGRASISIPDLLGKIVAVELAHFRESETRRIFASFLLKMIYDYRVSAGKSELRHVCVIEEASNIVPYRDPKSPPSIGEKMVSELRKFGEGLIVICQFPSQVSHGIMKNSGIRICHRIGGIEEEKIVMDLIGLTHEQFQHIKYLKPGHAVVYVCNYANPFLISVEPSDQTSGGVALS
ncbi:MAG: ATP-binding protein [Thermoproteota archaeon]